MEGDPFRFWSGLVRSGGETAVVEFQNDRDSSLDLGGSSIQTEPWNPELVNRE